MSEEIKRVPSGAEQIQTFQLFQKTCQAELDNRAAATHQAAVPFDPAKALVVNHDDGDGEFELTYQDNSLDFNCSAQVQWESQEILIRSGDLAGHMQPVLGTYISDAKTLTEKLVGKDEFAGKTAYDGAYPQMVGADKYVSVQRYNKWCKARFEQFGQKIFKTKKLGDRFDPSHVRIVNESMGDGVYNLLFENHASDFFCEGIVINGGDNDVMFLRSGTIQDRENADPSGNIQNDSFEMTDACSMTQGLIGKGEVSDNCKDHTESERKWRTVTHVIEGILLAGLTVVLPVLKYRRKALPALVHRIARMPAFARRIAYGLIGYTAFDKATELFGLDEDNPIRQIGSIVAGGLGCVAPNILTRLGWGTSFKVSPSLFWGAAGVWASDRAADGLGLGQHSTARKYIKIGGGVTGFFAPTMIARIGLTARLASLVGSRALLKKGLTSAFRIAKGALLLGIADLATSAVSDNYEQWLNERAADQVYRQDGLYDWGWKKIVNPLSWLNKSRHIFRWMAPTLMNRRIAQHCPLTSDCEDLPLKTQLRNEDQALAKQAWKYLNEVMPKLLNSGTPEEFETLVSLLQREVSLTKKEEQLVPFFLQGPEEVQKQAKLLFNQPLSEQEYEDFDRKVVVQSVQAAVQTVGFIPNPYADVIQQLFDYETGTLKTEIDDDGNKPYEKARLLWSASAIREDPWAQ